MRHFPTRLNERNISRGHLPVGIDRELAEELVPKVAATLDRYGVTKLISSDLPRAAQSAKLIAEHMAEKPKVESDAKLETWDPGMEGEKESVTVPKRIKYIKYSDETPPGGEPFDEFVERFRSQRDRIMKPNTAFVAHGHHLLAAPSALMDEDIEPESLNHLDEDFPPGGVYGGIL